MRRGFTLMELMVVVGIMAFLGVAATNGYNALQRGMAERGAVDAASALLKAAKERAMVDRVPTAVFCYNRMLREASDDANAVVVGEAVAIRRAGRISRVQGSYLYDEFGDLDRSYDRLQSGQQSDLQGRKGMRLWRFDDRRMNQMQYSVVADAVFDDDNMPGVSFMPWGDQLAGGGTSSSNMDMPDPWLAIDNLSPVLRSGGRVCAYVPNANQVESIFNAFKERGYRDVHALENLQRGIEVHPGGVRPAFDMLGHSGYMVFARKRSPQGNPGS